MTYYIELIKKMKNSFLLKLTTNIGIFDLLSLVLDWMISIKINFGINQGYQGYIKTKRRYWDHWKSMKNDPIRF